MSELNTSSTTSGMAAISARAKDAAVQAVPIGRQVGTTAVQGVRQDVQGAMYWATPRVEDAVYGAREWAAPRLEVAADAVTASVAPRVSSWLRSAARQVRPEPAPTGKTGISSLLDWRWLVGIGTAVAAASATAAIAMRRRYATATAEAKEATESSDEEGAQDGDAAGEAAHSDVNGQVTTPRR